MQNVALPPNVLRVRVFSGGNTQARLTDRECRETGLGNRYPFI